MALCPTRVMWSLQQAEGVKGDTIRRGYSLLGAMSFLYSTMLTIGRSREVPEIKAHLECKGLLLKGGLIHAIPELEGHVDGVEMSHEAAVGKIAQEEISYLMSRGLSEEEATSRSFVAS